MRRILKLAMSLDESLLTLEERTWKSFQKKLRDICLEKAEKPKLCLLGHIQIWNLLNGLEEVQDVATDGPSSKHLPPDQAWWEMVSMKLEAAIYAKIEEITKAAVDDVAKRMLRIEHLKKLDAAEDEWQRTVLQRAKDQLAGIVDGEGRTLVQKVPPLPQGWKDQRQSVLSTKLHLARLNLLPEFPMPHDREAPSCINQHKNHVSFCDYSPVEWEG